MFVCVPTDMIGESRDMEETMSPQDGLDHNIKPITHNRKGDVQLRALAVKHKNAVIDREVCRESCDGIPIGSDQFNLTRQAFLTRNLSIQPPFFPCPPGGKRERLEYGIVRVNDRYRAIEITKHLCPADQAAPA